MYQRESLILKTIGMAFWVVGVIGCAHSPSVSVKPGVVLPSVRISKVPKRSSATLEPLVERLVVATVQPSVGQKVSFETTIVNKDTRRVHVTENFLGATRHHVLNPGEMMAVTYSYNRQLQKQVIAEYQLRPADSEIVSKISLSELKDGFGCQSLGTWCRVTSLPNRGQAANFRFSIPVGGQTYVGSTDDY